MKRLLILLALFPLFARAGDIVASVEYVEVTWDNGAISAVNLTKGQDEVQCVPFYSTNLVSGGLADDFRERLVKVEIIDNAGTAAIQLTQGASTADTDDRITGVFVVEFESAIRVEQVAADIADTVSSVNVTITDVEAQDDAFFVHTYNFDDTVAYDSPDSVAIRATWNGASTTSITIDRSNNNGAIDGVLYIVDADADEFIVDHQAFSMGATDESTTATISATVLADSFTVHSYKSGENGDDPLDGAAVADLQDTTTIRLRKSIAGAVTSGSDHHVQVVEAQDNEWDVQRADETMNSTGETATISSVTQANSVVKLGTHHDGVYDLGTSDLTAGNSIFNLAVKTSFNSSTETAYDRFANTETGNIVPWEVIDFTGTAAGVCTTCIRRQRE